MKKKLVLLTLLCGFSFHGKEINKNCLNLKKVKLNKTIYFESFGKTFVTIKDTIPNSVHTIKNEILKEFKMGSINLSDEFNPFLIVEKNTGINVFKFTVPFDGNVLLNGFVSAGTNGKMLYSRLIKNGEIISEKTCGIGNPLFNGSFNYHTLVKAGDKLSIQILVHDFKWQLHCCPDLYNCTYIISETE